MCYYKFLYIRWLFVMTYITNGLLDDIAVDVYK